MASKRVLVLGRPSALSRELAAAGHSVDHVSAGARALTALPSGTWDACVLGTERLCREGYDLVRKARQLHPGLALAVSVMAEGDGAEAALVSGADDWLSAGTPARPSSQVLSQAISARRERVRSRGLPSTCRVVALDWDQLEAPLVSAALERHRFSVARVTDGRAALAALRERPTHVLITPPSVTVAGAEIVAAALRYDPRLRVVVASEHLELEGTAAAIGCGASDYLLRPVGPAQALGAVRQAWSAYANTTPSGAAQERVLQVLLLEPHPLQAHLLEEMLAQDGPFATTTARDLAEARRCLAEHTFDAVLYRPLGTRHEAIRILQELRSIGPHPAILLIADRLGAETREQALRLGAQDIISGERLGQEALGARVRNASARNHYRLAHERFIRDLQSREASQREVVRRSADGMLIVDAAEMVVFCNPAAERMFERFGAPLLGRPFPYPPSREGQREVEIGEGSGRRVAEMTEVPIDYSGAPARLISLRDITERRQALALRDRLAHTERLAAIGQLAAGVTHEINNPAAYVVANLTSMLDLIGELERKPPSGHQLGPKLREMSEILRENLDGMARIRSIASDLRTFARIGTSEVSLVDLNDCIISACKIAKGEIRQRAHLVQELSEVPRIHGSPGKLAQVVLNLLINAAHAIPEGDAETHRITVRSRANAEEVWLQVEDTGAGIPPLVRDKIFDPFFTTKPRAQGTGLGLSLCADIVGQHQGSITAAPSARGRGTCFEVRFPRDTQLRSSSPPSPPSRVVAKAASDHPLRLLLIDDEPLVLRSLQRMLGNHRVEVAQGGSEALRKLEADRGYDLIFCDLMMPDMDGTVLYAELERRMPELLDKVVFCSGGAFTARTKQFVEHSNRPIIEKPMTRESFERAVADWLDRRRQEGPRSTLASASAAR